MKKTRFRNVSWLVLITIACVLFPTKPFASTRGIVIKEPLNKSMESSVSPEGRDLKRESAALQPSPVTTSPGLRIAPCSYTLQVSQRRH